MDSRARIAARLESVRQRTLQLFAPLAGERMRVPPDPIMSPPLWDLGHIAAYEELWLVERLGRGASLHPELQGVYDAFETPRRDRGEAPILEEGRCRDYLDRVRERALEALAQADLDEDAPALTAGGFVFEMIAEHEAQHTETVLQALKLLPSGAYAIPAHHPLPPANGVVEGGWERVPAGEFEMGAGPSGFAYDCERPRHRRRLEAFEIGRHPVSNGEHLAFMADGGYERAELWSAEGDAWRQGSAVRAPLYWEPDGAGGWLVSDYRDRVPVDPLLPLCHVSFHEAEAHARWAGARLPTEAEWECAASWDGIAAREYPWGEGSHQGRANLDQLGWGPAPVGSFPDGAAPSGCLQMVGDVWEWTATELAGYPGFRAFPYPQYSEVFFGRGHRVLRGGSWATQPHAVRGTFRNWDLPLRRQVFSGLRLARDAR